MGLSTLGTLSFIALLLINLQLLPPSTTTTTYLSTTFTPPFFYTAVILSLARSFSLFLRCVLVISSPSLFLYFLHTRHLLFNLNVIFSFLFSLAISSLFLIVIPLSLSSLTLLYIDSLSFPTIILILYYHTHYYLSHTHTYFITAHDNY